jgi:hypothetical protein
MTILDSAKRVSAMFRSDPEPFRARLRKPAAGVETEEIDSAIGASDGTILQLKSDQ